MRVAVTTVQVPFIRGGAEAHAEGLVKALAEHGCQVEMVTMPFRFGPPAEVLRTMDVWAAEDFARFDCGGIDRVICLKFPTYYLRHPNKVVWLLHQRPASNFNKASCAAIPSIFLRPPPYSPTPAGLAPG